jgi:spore coat polysaccharide biosynthesis predicted glycosyltransferase SpsG
MEINKLSDQKMHIFKDTPAQKIRELMFQSDLAISGGGQTIYELANVGLPAIIIQQANNQQENIQSWKKIGFIEYVGKASDPKTLNNINSAIIKLNSKRLRQQRSRIGRKLIDGLGAKRVAEIIHEKTD